MEPKLCEAYNCDNEAVICENHDECTSCSQTAEFCSDHAVKECSNEYCDRNAELCSYHAECTECSQPAVSCDTHSSGGECQEGGNNCEGNASYTYCDTCHSEWINKMREEIRAEILAELAMEETDTKDAARVKIESNEVSVDGTRFAF